jgi:DNA-binding NarL/FixJ family response regulator
MHGTHGAPVRVLIADDHPVVRQGLRHMLESDPEVDVVGEARDGDEAFDMAHKVEWDVAVLDYSMPGRGGVELLSDVKHDYPDRPVLILRGCGLSRPAPPATSPRRARARSSPPR